MTQFKNGIFISYSHRDKRWLDAVLTVLKPYARNEQIRVWNDQKIVPGQQWAEEIRQAINESRVAVLLVTPNFLASDYIMNKELPLILNNQREGKLIVYWIAVSHAAYYTTELNALQAANNPKKPLDQLDKPTRNKVLVDIAAHIGGAMDINAIGNTLKIIDRFVPQQRAFLDNTVVDNRDTNYSIQATQYQDNIELTNNRKQVVENITIDDLARLDRNAKLLIRTYESTMKDLFERWTELQPKSYARDPVLREETRQEMELVRKDLCHQLTAILNFLHSIGKNLDDHYHHVRFICAERPK